MKKIIITILLLISSLANAIEEISIGPAEATYFGKSLKFLAPFSKELSFYLEYGDTLSESVVQIKGTTNSVRIATQLETSLSVNREGPHLDLIEWKHCTSDWIPLQYVIEGRFIFPELTDEVTSCFPKVTHIEMREEVFRVGGESWVNTLEEKGLPEGYSPISVSLSTVRIRIEEKIGGKWVLVTIVHVSIPMGC